MSRLRRPPALTVGESVRFDGQVRSVLEVTAQAAVLEDAKNPHRVVALIELFEAEDFEVLFRPERMPLPASSVLETLPAAAVQQALWWEGHCQSGSRRALSRQNSLPSGSARTCQDASPG